MDFFTPGIFVGAGHALRLQCFLKKFNPYRVVVSRGIVFSSEIRPLQGHSLFIVNRTYFVVRILFLLLTFNPQAPPRRSEQIIGTLAHWHISTLDLAH